MASLAWLLLCCFCIAAVCSPCHANGTKTLRFVNKCSEEIWVGALGSSILDGGGWAVAPGRSAMVAAPPGWHGRFWGRTGCRFDGAGRGSCQTGDCGGLARCGGTGGQPPATLAEFSFGPPLDFYDVSLVDGYNLPVTVTPVGGGRAGGGRCRPAGCSSNVNAFCPAALRVADGRDVVACRSACNAFSKPEYCCTGPYSQPSTCRPSSYSRLFKRACPRAYTYAYDDPTSVFACSAPNSYLITFCG